MKKIVVLAGDRKQFQYWLRHNIIPLTNREDLLKLQGIEVEVVYKEGTYCEWFSAQDEMLLSSRIR